MARLNTPVRPTTTHEGGTASRTNLQELLRRSVLSCLLWENTFYEDGESIAERITTVADQCSPEFVSELAKEARNEYRLRHAPLWLSMSLIRRGGKLAGQTLTDVVQRPDEITEALAMYWKDGKKPLSNQLKIGLSNAFNKFDEYQLAKYNRDSEIKLRDALFMVHAKPKDKAQAEIFKRLVDNELAIPETWETRLSAGQDKKESFTDLLKRNKLGYMALLRNLRNMTEAGVNRSLIEEKLRSGATKSKALPFRYLAAAITTPSLESVLDECMLKAFDGLPRFKGRTVVLVDVSGSMAAQISERSTMRRFDAAAGLAIYCREASDDCRVFMFGTKCAEVPNRRGMALRDVFVGGGSKLGHGTQTWAAIETVNKQVGEYDRLIVITDEQTRDHGVVEPLGNSKGYILNVAPNQNGIGYGLYTHINGWSEQSIRYIQETES